MSQFTRRQVTVLELDLDRCANNYGALPCTAGTETTTGTSQAGGSATTIKLAAGASSSDGAYDGQTVTLDDGRRGIVASYVGATRIATMVGPWRQNLLDRSQEFEDAAWIKTNAAASDDQAKAPDLTLTAASLVENSSDVAHQVERGDAISAATQYRLSVHLAPAGRQYGRLVAETDIGAIGHLAFDLVAGVFTATTLGAWHAERLPGGMWRLSIVFTTQGGAADLAASGVRMWDTATGGSSGGDAYQGDGVSGLLLWGGQLAPAVAADDHISTAAASIDTVDGLVYRVLEVSGECYNTIATCQDTPNFIKVGQMVRFADRGAPIPLGEEIRPLISAKSFAATEIDLEAGLARRGTASLTLRDAPAPDGALDPYRATRAAPAQSTFLARLIARNPNASGRPARLRRAYLAGAWAWSDFVDERYVIESLKGPDSSGEVRVVLKDPIKLLDRRKIPEPSTGKLAAALVATDLSLELGPGQGASYPSSGHVRVGKEILEFTGNAGDVLTWPSVANRGTFGTTAAEASLGGAVQICRTWQDIPVTEVMQDLLTDSGIDLADIDVAGFAIEEADWFGPAFNVTTALSTSENSSKLLAELVLLVRGYMWWDPTDRVRFEVLAPLTPIEAAAETLTDAANLVAGSIRVEPRDDLRSTTRALYYGLVAATENRGEAANYLRAQIFIDADAEGPNEYNDRRVVTAFSRWWGPTNDAAALAVVSRAAGYYRDAPIKVEARVSAKDFTRREGDQVDLETAQLVDFDGVARVLRCIITRRQDQGGEIALKLRSTGFALRYGFIGDNSIGDYPADPEYAHIAPDAGFADGSDFYRIF